VEPVGLRLIGQMASGLLPSHRLLQAGEPLLGAPGQAEPMREEAGRIGRQDLPPGTGHVVDTLCHGLDAFVNPAQKHLTPPLEYQDRRADDTGQPRFFDCLPIRGADEPIARTRR